MSTCQVNRNAGRTGLGINLCHQPAIYAVWTANCYACTDVLGLPECAGHPCCVEHGMALRTTAMYDKTSKATLARICTLEPTP